MYTHLNSNCFQKSESDCNVQALVYIIGKKIIPSTLINNFMLFGTIYLLAARYLFKYKNSYFQSKKITNIFLQTLDIEEFIGRPDLFS